MRRTKTSKDDSLTGFLMNIVYKEILEKKSDFGTEF